MKLDIVLNKGDDNKPAVVFIHGLGMDKNIWADPAKSRILGGMFPLRILINKKRPYPYRSQQRRADRKKIPYGKYKGHKGIVYYLHTSPRKFHCKNRRISV